jgi:hypothetical protein
MIKIVAVLLNYSTCLIAEVVGVNRMIKLKDSIPLSGFRCYFKMIFLMSLKKRNSGKSLRIVNIPLVFTL